MISLRQQAILLKRTMYHLHIDCGHCTSVMQYNNMDMKDLFHEISYLIQYILTKYKDCKGRKGEEHGQKISLPSLLFAE